MSAPLVTLKIEGYRSIHRLELPLTSEVTLLVGANGSGKSNIIATFELLGRIIDKRLQREVLRQGGLGGMLHRSATGKDAHDVRLEVWTQQQRYGDTMVQNGYRVQLSAASDDEALLDEKTYTHVLTYPKPYEVQLGVSKESRLQSAADEHPANWHLLNALSGCRVFHFDDTSVDAPPLRTAEVADCETLHDDGANLAAVLYFLSKHDRPCYERIVRSVQTVAPFFDDFVLKPAGEGVRMRWREKGLDAVHGGSALSSGTLRFICLATLLQQPLRPTTIVLDEPELGLHPFAIHQLADLLQEAAKGRRIVAATQSVTLLGQFAVDQVAIVDRTADGTTVQRPDEEFLRAWLDDYSLGDLWEMNLLGGRPQAPAGAGC